jgi:hypothetical protein
MYWSLLTRFADAMFLTRAVFRRLQPLANLLLTIWTLFKGPVIGAPRPYTAQLDQRFVGSYEDHAGILLTGGMLRVFIADRRLVRQWATHMLWTGTG